MSWLEVALVVAVLIGAASGTALVVRNSSFWVEMGGAVFKAVLPIILARKSPEAEARDHADVRRRVDRTITGRER